jgi:hypothetical protein
VTKKQSEERRKKWFRIILGIIIAVVVLGPLAGVALSQEIAPMTKADAEEFCVGVVPKESMHYVYCGRALQEGTTTRDLSEITLTEVTPEMYPMLAAAIVSHESSESSATSFTLTVEAFSQYLDVNGAVYHDRPVLQTDFFVETGNGIYVGGWLSVADASWWSTYGHELDVYAGHFGTYHDVGVMYLKLSKLDPSDMVEVYAKFGKQLEPTDNIITPYLWLEHYAPVKGTEPVQGSLARLGFQYNWNRERRTIVGRFGAFYDDGLFGESEGVIGEFEWQMLYQLKNELSIGPRVRCAIPVHRSFEDSRDSTCVFGLTIENGF